MTLQKYERLAFRRRRLFVFAGGNINNNASICAMTVIMCQVYLKFRLQIAERRLGDKINPFVHASKSVDGLPYGGYKDFSAYTFELCEILKNIIFNVIQVYVVCVCLCCTCV